jgi:hypothetical protein
MALKDRVKEAVSASGKSVPVLAGKIGVHKNAIYQWLDGTSKNLKGAHLYALSRESGFSAEWIATGRGTKHELKPLAHGADSLDLSFLTTVLQAVEKYLDDQDLTLEAEPKAKLIALLYETCAQKGIVEGPVVARYLRLVA